MPKNIPIHELAELPTEAQYELNNSNKRLPAELEGPAVVICRDQLAIDDVTGSTFGMPRVTFIEGFDSRGNNLDVSRRLRERSSIPGKILQYGIEQWKIQRVARAVSRSVGAAVLRSEV